MALHGEGTGKGTRGTGAALAAAARLGRTSEGAADAANAGGWDVANSLPPSAQLVSRHTCNFLSVS